MPDDIVDLLKCLLERNEQYHDVKERVVWLAGVIYLTFSAALVGWYLKVGVSIPCELKNPVLYALSAIYILTVAFIIRQTREKAHSTMITSLSFFRSIHPPVFKSIHPGTAKCTNLCIRTTLS